MTDTATWLLIAALGYLIGSIPTAWLVARRHGVDIFAVGSGNMGGTNVARAVSARAGQLVGLLDMAKCLVAILFARALAPTQPDEATVLAALVCMLGHNWSLTVLLLTGRLRGGKGAAVVFASLLLIAPQLLLVGALVGFVILRLTRYVSLAVLVGLGLALLWLLVLVRDGALPPVYNVYAAFVALLILLRFAGNIRRLLAGNERRLGDPA